MVEMHAIMRGRVQGVGFRWTTEDYAQQLGLVGTVRNVPDGTVEIYAQGPKEKLLELIKKLRDHFRLDQSEEVEFIENPERFFEDFRIITH